MTQSAISHQIKTLEEALGVKLFKRLNRALLLTEEGQTFIPSVRQALDLLLPVRYRAHAFGGSHAQRDIVHRTVIEAALRAGQAPLAHALACERTAQKPHCPFSWQLRRRAADAEGKGSMH